MSRPDTLLAASRSLAARDDSEEPCPSCGEANDVTAADCRGCGSSLVLFPGSATSRKPAVSFWSPDGAPPVEEALDYAPGEVFADRYIIIDRLGQGGMGVVYKARDRELDRTVALKMIRGALERDSETLERFRREPGLAQQVTHENVCRVYDLGIAVGVRYLTMEYLEAENLSALIATLGALSVKQTLQLGVQIAAGLEAIHARGIIHRDLKPSNIAVDKEGRVAVMDFGLARGPIDSEVTQPGVLVGSYAYLAPEHIRGEPLGFSADVYGLGLLLFEMLTGRRPPGDPDQRPLALRGEGAVCPPPSRLATDSPSDLDGIVRRCLSWKPEDRPGISDVRAALEAALEREAARTRPRRRPVFFSPRLRAAAAVALLGSLFLSGLALRSNEPEPASIALIPFDVEGNDTEARFLTALSEDALSAGLRASPDTRVILVERELRDEPPAEVLRALGADWLLRGKVLVENGAIEWRAELADAGGNPLYRDSVRGPDPLTSLERVRDELLETLHRPPGAAPGIGSLRTSNLEAYRRYLEARSLHDGWYARGDVEKARSLYRQALRLDGSFAAAHAGQALASFARFLSTGELGDMSVARYASDRALAFGETLPEAHLAKATVLAGEKRWEEAREVFARAFELSPGDDFSRRNIANLYETLGRMEEARRLYEEAVEQAPLHWVNHFWYGQFLYRAGNLEAALVSLERASELEPDAPGPQTFLGFYHLAAGDLAEASRRFERALELSSDTYARQRLGLVHYYAGRYDRALEHWSVVLESMPELPNAHVEIADALRQLGRAKEAQGHYERAVSLYDQALRTSPEDDVLVAERAQVLAALGRCEEARSSMSFVLERHPDHPEFLYYGALAASRCRIDDLAVDLVLKSIGAGNVVGIWFDPDLARMRKDPRVQRPLELIGGPQRPGNERQDAIPAKALQ